jgi:hypothetical protein
MAGYGRIDTCTSGTIDPGTSTATLSSMRQLFPVLLLCLSLFSEFATANSTLPNLPTEPPVELNGTGRKIWQTLINGEPQWQNWPDLLTKTAKSQTVQTELAKIWSLISEQLRPHELELTYKSLEPAWEYYQNHELEKMDLNLPSPAMIILRSFDRALLQKRKPSLVSLAFADRRAWNVSHSKPIHDQPSDIQKFHFLKLRSKYELLEEFQQSRPLTRDEFERWRLLALEEVAQTAHREELKLYRTLFEDSRVWGCLRYTAIDSSLNPTAPKPLITILNPQSKVRIYLKDELPAKFKRQLDEYFHNSQGFNPRITDDDYLFYIIHPTSGLIGVNFEGLDIYNIRNISLNGSPYDFARRKIEHLYPSIQSLLFENAEFAEALLNLFAYQDEGTVPNFEGKVFAPPWTPDIRVMRNNIVRLAIELAKEKGFSGILDQNWMQRTFLESLSTAERSYRWGELLFMWQVATYGYDFWEMRARNAEQSALPRLQFTEDLNDDNNYDTGPFYVTSHWNIGNFAKENEEKIALFRIFRLNEVAWPVRFRVASVESLKDMQPFQPSSLPGSLRLRNEKDLAQNLDGNILPLPSPEGFEPTTANAHVLLVRSGKEILLKRTDISFVFNKKMREFGIRFKRIQDITEVRDILIDYIPVAPKSSSELPKIEFDKNQIQPVIDEFVRIKAYPLARSLSRWKILSPGLLAKMISEESRYSFDPVFFRGDNFEDFVDSGSRLQLQCSLATEILRLRLIDAMKNHPLRFRVKFRKVSTFSQEMSGENTLTLRFPLHSTLEYFVDNTPIEILDATPFLYANYEDSIKSNSNTVPRETMSPDLHATLSLLSLNREAIHRHLSMMGRKSFDSSLPIIKLNLIVKQIIELLKAKLEKTKWDEAEFRKNLRPLIGPESQTLPLLELFDILKMNLKELREQTIALSTQLEANQDPNLEAAARKSGADILLNPAVVELVSRSAQEAELILNDCELILML